MSHRVKVTMVEMAEMEKKVEKNNRMARETIRSRPFQIQASPIRERPWKRQK